MTTAIQHLHHLCSDLQYYKIHNWIQINITSSAKLLECSSGHLKYVQTFSLQQESTSLSSNRMGLDTSEAYPQVHQGNHAPQVPHLTSTTSRSLTTTSAVDNTYCDSDWATDIDSRKSTSGTVASVPQVPLAFDSRTQSTVATSSTEDELYAIGLGISDSLHIYQLLQELQHHFQRPTFDFGNLETQYNITISTATKPLTSTKSPIHIFTDSTSALSLGNKLGLNKRSKHIALRYLFFQDIQATGLVNIQRVTSRNNPADIYIKCGTFPVLERHLRHNGIIEWHIEEGEINYFHILEFADFNVTSDGDLEYTEEQRRKMKDNKEYTREQRLREQMKQLYLNKQKKK